MNAYIRLAIAATFVHTAIIWGFFFWEKANVIENYFCQTGKITTIEIDGTDISDGPSTIKEREYLYTVALPNGNLVVLREYSLRDLLTKAMEISAESADERCMPVFSAWRIETADPYKGLSDRILGNLQLLETAETHIEFALQYLSDMEKIDVRIIRFKLVPRNNAFILLWLLPLVALWVLLGIAFWVKVGFKRVRE